MKLHVESVSDGEGYSLHQMVYYCIESNETYPDMWYRSPKELLDDSPGEDVEKIVALKVHVEARRGLYGDL